MSDDELLVALRAVRERCIQIIRDDMGVQVFAGAAATWIWRRLNDAALLELAGVKGGDANSGDRRSNSPDMNEAGADVNAPSAGGVPEKTGPTTASSYVCMWCHKTYAEHGEFPGPFVPGMPCLGLRVGFRAKQAAEPAEQHPDPPFAANARPWFHLGYEQGKRIALLDAARDLREWAKDWSRPVNNFVSWQQEQRVIVQCADRLEARAKELVAK